MRPDLDTVAGGFSPFLHSELVAQKTSPSINTPYLAVAALAIF